jgi:hypothetical protein
VNFFFEIVFHSALESAVKKQRLSRGIEEAKESRVIADGWHYGRRRGEVGPRHQGL